MTYRRKIINACVITVFILAVVFLLYPICNKYLQKIRTHSYVYSYSLPENIEVEDTSKLPPAQAVPVLMYHGVIAEGSVNVNTSRENFISQMEMLKKKGYKTISIHEYDLFREKKFILPPKPIIITFDDGRKDSFYTVDDILKKLGFKATIFIATVKPNSKDPFYLNWEELAQMSSTGRWEIEAHGQRSHDEVVVDEKGTLGTYLTSRIFTPKEGTEDVEKYKKRVETDYANSISDIKEHLGIDAKYFAVPLNDYGDFDVSNYQDAYKYNQELTSRFFKLAFVQAKKDNGLAIESFYNYCDSNPYTTLKRLGVENIDSGSLYRLLEYFAPTPPNLIFPNIGGMKTFLQSTQLLYGQLKTDGYITLVSSKDTPSARVLFGDKKWKNYSIKTTIIREKGHSVSVIAYYTDEYNFLSVDWGEKSIKLVEHFKGKERELVSYYPWNKNGEVKIYLRVHSGAISAYFDEILLTKGIPINLVEGAAGLGVWDPNGAQSTMKKLEIKDMEQ
jgi:peptidoglycan/xylan/chitin deacetylase (PgdA/CDA1 family)